MINVGTGSSNRLQGVVFGAIRQNPRGYRRRGLAPPAEQSLRSEA